jgi:hypothetical protein
MRRREQAEDPDLTPSQRQAVMMTLYAQAVLPITGGKVRHQDVFLPPDGWQGSHDEWLAEYV